MRKTTLLWLCLAVFCGAVLFNTSQKVTDGRERLAQLQGDVQSEEESIRVLQAEWSYLNQPERLEKLAKQYLDLAPMNGRQFAKAESIEAAPAPAAEEAAPEEIAKKLIEDAPKPVSEPAAPAPKKTAEPKTAAAAKAKAVPTPKPKIVAKPQPSPASVRAAAKPATPRPVSQTATAPKRSFDDMLKGLDLE